MTRSIIISLIAIAMLSCTGSKQNSGITFMVADPGHFHAALVLKSMYPGVDSSVYVYAPDGPELSDFKKRVEGYRTREADPAKWNLKTLTGPDFFERMLSEKPGNVLVLAGNNERKTEYIGRAIESGLNIYSDKPMAINPEDFAILQQAFKAAEAKGLLLYDIMTERFEISSILQKEISQIPKVFGELLKGSPDDPAVTKESVHHFFKYVSGSRLVRPAWFFDVKQEGEGIVDVTTHLVDLVQWACFPEQIIDYQKDIKISSSRKWNTPIQPRQFTEVTGSGAYPAFLVPYVDADSLLQVACNGEINYQLKGVNVKVSVIWNYQAPEGAGDTHFSVMKGSLARLEIRQGPEQKFKPELYLFPNQASAEYQDILNKSISALAIRFPGIQAVAYQDGFQILIPDSYRVGHEAHFTQVTQNFLSYLKNGNLPAWEVPNMLAKYWLTTEA